MWTNTAVTFHKLLDKSNIDIHNYLLQWRNKLYRV